MLTVAGTVAIAGLFDVRVAVRPPAGAGGDNVSVRLPVWFWLTERFAGVRVAVEAVTCTVPVPFRYVGAVPVIMAEPILTPVTCAGVAGVVAPAAMNTVGVTVTVDGSLLVSVTVTPPVGAACESVTGTVTVWVTTTFVSAIWTVGGGCTVTFAVAPP
jgi:hypothetical protein